MAAASNGPSAPATTSGQRANRSPAPGRSHARATAGHHKSQMLRATLPEATKGAGAVTHWGSSPNPWAGATAGGATTAKPKAPPPTPSRDQCRRDPTAHPHPRPQAFSAEGKSRGRRVGGTPGPPDPRSLASKQQCQGYLDAVICGAGPQQGPLRPPHRARRTWKAGPSGPERREQAPLFATRREPPAPRGSPQKPQLSASLPTGSPKPTIQGPCQVSLEAQLPQVSRPHPNASTRTARSRRNVAEVGPRKRKSSKRGTSPTHRSLPAGPLLVSQLPRPPSLSPSPGQRRK